MGRVNRALALASLVIVLGVGTSVLSQGTEKPCERIRKVPQAILPFAYLIPNMFPVTLANAEAYLGPDDLKFAVDVRNNSEKEIRAVSLSFWHLGGSGGDRLPLILDKGILPGKEGRIGVPKCGEVRILSDAELRSRRIETNRIQTIIVVTIREVVFADGSVITDGGLTKRFHEFEGRIKVDSVR